MTEFRVMTRDDLSLFLRLTGLVGWGMTEQDFDRLITFSPEGNFVASVDGVDVGMVGTTSYGEVAWIGNLIVDPETRGRGLGAALTVHAMNHLKDHGVKSIRLDGVPLAIPLYRRLGYVDEYWSMRYMGEARPQPVTGVEPMRKADLDEVSRLDLEHFNAPRRGHLEYVYRLSPGLCFTARVSGRLVGYIMGRDGSDRVRVGPWICEPGHSKEAEALLGALMNRRPGQRVWVGFPEGNAGSRMILEKNGFREIPSSLRMCHGDRGNRENVKAVYGLGGPDKG
ncbi:MAG: GNAT family N-acetyltransferase [Candidatus Bathyarchaeota archaeon]